MTAWQSTPSTDSSSSINDDQRWMAAALELAQLGEGFVEPNPMVGCVLVRDGVCVGKGYHQRFGGPHAEVEAIRSATNTESIRGATAYVTLEPCCHHGKTPPCADALIDAGIRRVVVATEDPFPRVAGGGLKKLRDQGIDVTVGMLEKQAKQLLAPYLKLTCTAQPWVIAKWAMTIDGRIATRTGSSQWITGDAARKEVHTLRGRVDAIAVGMGTVIADDPMLTARPAGPRTARRIVFTGQRLPCLGSKLITSANETPVLLVTGPSASQRDLDALRQAGAQILACDSDEPTERVTQTLSSLGQAQVTNMMLEGGGGLLGSFFDAGAIDECHVYLGAKAFGGSTATSPIGGQGIATVAEALALELASIDRFDDDVRLIYRRSS